MRRCFFRGGFTELGKKAVEGVARTARSGTSDEVATLSRGSIAMGPPLWLLLGRREHRGVVLQTQLSCLGYLQNGWCQGQCGVQQPEALTGPATDSEQ